eukprot:Selendium_serpulae@DN3765_c1_g1_i2.p2
MLTGRPQVWQLAVAAAAAAGVWYLTAQPRRQRRGGKQSLSGAETVALLDKMSRELFDLFTEMAQVAHQAYESIKRKGYAEAIHPKTMEAMLMQDRFGARLLAAKEKVLADCDVDSDVFAKAVVEFDTNEEMTKLSAGIDAMYNDALMGVLPICSFFEGDQLDQDATLTVLGSVHAEKQRRFRAIFDKIDSAEHAVYHPSAGFIPSEELAAKLMKATEESEASVFETHKLVKGDKVKFYHSLALHSRDKSFKTKKEAMASVHSDIVTDIMRPKGASSSATRFPMEVRIEDVTEEDHEVPATPSAAQATTTTTTTTT